MSATNGNGNGTNGNGNGKRGSLPQVSDPVADLAPIEGFPASEKVYVEADDVRIRRGRRALRARERDEIGRPPRALLGDERPDRRDRLGGRRGEIDPRERPLLRDFEGAPRRRRRSLAPRGGTLRAGLLAHERFEIDAEWNRNTLEFSRSGVEGEIAVTVDSVSVHADISWLLLPIKSAIEQEISRYLDQEFGS